MTESETASQMTPERWCKIRRILDELLLMPIEKRDAYIESSCREDASLVVHIHDLVAHMESTLVETPLDNPAVGSPFNVGSQLSSIQATRSLKPVESWPENDVKGLRVGRYTIRRGIGQGGMGTVYEAIQDIPRRRVALKIMRTGLATRSMINRFRFETEVLGRLNHPNIAQIFDAGVHYESALGDSNSCALPYFAMEFVEEGSAISEFCETGDLDIRERLVLFVDACRAIHHGHQKAVIHRDIKPNNLLISRDGVVKVIDFGVARSTDSDLDRQTLAVETSGIIGTLQYMSPEQCSGQSEQPEIDVTSDVYSLGVVLFEMLCGQLPYAESGHSVVSWARIISESPILCPGKINRSLRGDLEAILLMALKKNTSRRYQSAEAFAEDICRYLRRETISARPLSFRDKVASVIRYRPYSVMMIAAVSVSICIIAGSYLGTWYLNNTLGSVQRVGVGQYQVLTKGGKFLRGWNGAAAVVLVQGGDLKGLSEGVLVAAASHEPAESTIRGKLIYFALSDLDEPALEFAPPDHPPAFTERWNEILESGWQERPFKPCSVILADVFQGPDHPGKEIIATFRHSSDCPSVICIYDSEGEVLWERWHLGHLQTTQWSTHYSQIIAFGYRNDHLHDWSSLRDLDLPKSFDPTIAFAIQPSLAASSQRIIVDGSSTDPDLRWYGYFGPPRLWKELPDIWAKLGHSTSHGDDLLVSFKDQKRGPNFGIEAHLDLATGKMTTVVGTQQFRSKEEQVMTKSIRFNPWPPNKADLFPETDSSK